MNGIQALPMVGEDIDNSTVHHFLTSAFAYHPLELRLQRVETGNALLDFRKMTAGDVIGFGA